jgi:hypothetical protein
MAVDALYLTSSSLHLTYDDPMTLLLRASYCALAPEAVTRLPPTHVGLLYAATAHVKIPELWMHDTVTVITLPALISCCTG